MMRIWRRKALLREFMRLAVAVGSYLFCAGATFAQILPIPPPPPDSDWATPSSASPIHALFEPMQGYADAFPFWVQADFVLSRVREAPVNLPLVTSGNSKNKVPGAIGQAGTSVLFGDASIGFRM